jgi:protoporphyrinogen IX oxidase
MLWLKFLHISALAIWVPGLIYLPVLLWTHHKSEDQQEFARIRRASRYAYMGIVSPAAFVAIGAGGALLFVSDALHPWMFLKLVAVGVLVMAHMQYGAVLANLAEPDRPVPKLRLKAVAIFVLASSLATLWLVLAKPGIATDFLPDWLTEPGLLERPEASPPLPHQPRS